MGLKEEVLEKEYIDRCAVKDMILSSSEKEIIEMKDGNLFICDEDLKRGFIARRKDGQIIGWRVLVSKGDVRDEWAKAKFCYKTLGGKNIYDLYLANSG